MEEFGLEYVPLNPPKLPKHSKVFLLLTSLGITLIVASIIVGSLFLGTRDKIKNSSDLSDTSNRNWNLDEILLICPDPESCFDKLKDDKDTPVTCSSFSPDATFTVKDIVVPSSITRGQPFAVTFSGSTTMLYARVTLKIVIKVLGIPVYSKSLQAGSQFNGEFSYTTDSTGVPLTIPTSSPKGTYTTEFSFLSNDYNNKQIGCESIKLIVV